MMVTLLSIPHLVYGQECHSQSCISIREPPEHSDKNEEVGMEKESESLSTQEPAPEPEKEQARDPFILPFP